MHVDDGIGLATSERVARFIAAVIEGKSVCSQAETGYTVVMNRWSKMVGFDATITRHADYTTVSLSATGTLETLAAEHLADVPIYSPKHVVPSSIHELQPGVAPPVDSPDYQSFVDMQSKCASLNGSFVWLQQVYANRLMPYQHVLPPSPTSITRRRVIC